MDSSLIGMRVAARRTGLSPALIRVWERRYGAVTPRRSGTRRRLYNEAEIVRLQLLRDATRAGHAIGQIAHLGDGALRELLSTGPREERVGAASAAGAQPSGEDPVEECLAAIRRLEAAHLEAVLSESAALLGQWGMLERVIVPLVQRMGEEWQRGGLRVAAEHVATAAIASLLARWARACDLPEGAPRLLVCTPRGQAHELGALLAAVAANQQGWRVIYLGPNLPAEEIAGAARLRGVRAVALSLVYPEDDPLLSGELRRLRDLLPPGVVLMVGGRAASAYGDLLRSVGAVCLTDLNAMRSQLDALRHARPVGVELPQADPVGAYL
jgi:DNA-binding transcriptional MerR regulator/methylmalonyl-CoA mutase cobalamin-binding subunit